STMNTTSISTKIASGRGSSESESTIDCDLTHGDIDVPESDTLTLRWNATEVSQELVSLRIYHYSSQNNGPGESPTYSSTATSLAEQPPTAEILIRLIK